MPLMLFLCIKFLDIFLGLIFICGLLMFCTSCGKKNSNDSKFCFSCGMSMIGHMPVAKGVNKITAPHLNSIQDKSVDNNQSKNLIIGLVVIGLILVALSFKSVLSTSISVNSAPAETEYTYEPSIMSLNGVLVSPKGEDPNGRIVQYYAIEMQAPINVKGDKSDPINSETVNNLTLVQLTGESTLINKIKNNMGRRVILKGTLYHSHTGHHHTSVLMTVQSVNLN